MFHIHKQGSKIIATLGRILCVFLSQNMNLQKSKCVNQNRLYLYPNICNQKLNISNRIIFTTSWSILCCLKAVSFLFRMSCKTSKSDIATARSLPNQNPNIFPYFFLNKVNPFGKSAPNLYASPIKWSFFNLQA